MVEGVRMREIMMVEGLGVIYIYIYVCVCVCVYVCVCVRVCVYIYIYIYICIYIYIYIYIYIIYIDNSFVPRIVLRTPDLNFYIYQVSWVLLKFAGKNKLDLALFNK